MTRQNPDYQPEPEQDPTAQGETPVSDRQPEGYEPDQQDRPADDGADGAGAAPSSPSQQQ